MQHNAGLSLEVKEGEVDFIIKNEDDNMKFKITYKTMISVT